MYYKIEALSLGENSAKFIETLFFVVILLLISHNCKKIEKVVLHKHCIILKMFLKKFKDVFIVQWYALQEIKK
jgi:hypothetical protein